MIRINSTSEEEGRGGEGSEKNKYT
jgi:hypothetical protein